MLTAFLLTMSLSQNENTRLPGIQQVKTGGRGTLAEDMPGEVPQTSTSGHQDETIQRHIRSFAQKVHGDGDGRLTQTRPVNNSVQVNRGIISTPLGNNSQKTHVDTRSLISTSDDGEREKGNNDIMHTTPGHIVETSPVQTTTEDLELDLSQYLDEVERAYHLRITERKKELFKKISDTNMLEEFCEISDKVIGKDKAWKDKADILDIAVILKSSAQYGELSGSLFRRRVPSDQLVIPDFMYIPNADVGGGEGDDVWGRETTWAAININGSRANMTRYNEHIRKGEEAKLTWETTFIERYVLRPRMTFEKIKYNVEASKQGRVTSTIKDMYNSLSIMDETAGSLRRFTNDNGVEFLREKIAQKISVQGVEIRRGCNVSIESIWDVERFMVVLQQGSYGGLSDDGVRLRREWSDWFQRLRRTISGTSTQDIKNRIYEQNMILIKLFEDIVDRLISTVLTSYDICKEWRVYVNKVVEEVESMEYSVFADYMTKKPPPPVLKLRLSQKKREELGLPPRIEEVKPEIVGPQKDNNGDEKERLLVLAAIENSKEVEIKTITVKAQIHSVPNDIIMETENTIVKTKNTGTIPKTRKKEITIEPEIIPEVDESVLDDIVSSSTMADNVEFLKNSEFQGHVKSKIYFSGDVKSAPALIEKQIAEEAEMFTDEENYSLAVEGLIGDLRCNIYNSLPRNDCRDMLEKEIKLFEDDIDRTNPDKNKAIAGKKSDEPSMGVKVKKNFGELMMDKMGKEARINLIVLRAERLAHAIAEEPTRIMGLLALPKKRDLWKQLVSKAILKMGNGVRLVWAKKLTAQFPNMSENKKNKKIFWIKRILDIHSTKLPIKVLSEQDGSFDVRNWSRQSLDQVILSSTVSSVAINLVNNKVCPLCHYIGTDNSIVGDTLKRVEEFKQSEILHIARTREQRDPGNESNNDEGNTESDHNWEFSDSAYREAISNGSHTQAAEMVARAHNSEMHSSNGNTCMFDADVKGAMCPISSAIKNFSPHKFYQTETDDGILSSAQNHIIQSSISQGPTDTGCVINEVATRHTWIRNVTGGLSVQNNDLQIILIAGGAAVAAHLAVQGNDDAGLEDLPEVMLAFASLIRIGGYMSDEEWDACFDRLGVAAPDKPEDKPLLTARDINSLINENTKTWYSLSIATEKNCRKSTPSQVAADYYALMSEPPNKSGLLSSARAGNNVYYTNKLGPMFERARLITHITRANEDRQLIKAVLLESLRQKRFTQPTGVDWAVAEKAFPERYYAKPSRPVEYNIVAIGLDVLGLSMNRHNSRINVANQWWDLYSDRTIVIIHDMANGSPDSWLVWLLVRLGYPLVNVFEKFGIRSVGDVAQNRGEEVQPVDELFIRNECLVDIQESGTRIIVITTDPNTVSLPCGNTNIPVHQRNNPAPRGRAGIAPEEDLPVLVPTLITEDLMIVTRELLNGERDIRSLVDEHWQGKKTGEFDWTRATKKANMLTWRWSRQMESSITGGVNYIYNIPQVVFDIEAVGHPAWVRNDDSYVGKYNTDSNVDAFDGTPALRGQSRRVPRLKTGCWGNDMEMLMGLGMSLFDGKSVVNWNTAWYCCDLSLLRDLNILWRRSFEEYKRVQGWTDELVNPTAIPVFLRVWKDNVQEIGSDPLTYISQIMQTSIGRGISWESNRLCNFTRSQTGIRSSISMWKNNWINGAYTTQPDISSRNFMFDTAEGSNTFNRWVNMNREAQIDGILNDMMMRVNWNNLFQTVSYRSHPSGALVEGVSFRQATSTSIDTCWIAGGWVLRHAAMTGGAIGWGLNWRKRDWMNNHLKTLIMDGVFKSTLESKVIGHWNWAMDDLTSITLPYNTTNQLVTPDVMDLGDLKVVASTKPHQIDADSDSLAQQSGQVVPATERISAGGSVREDRTQVKEPGLLAGAPMDAVVGNRSTEERGE